MRKIYVVGFAFNDTQNSVVLIKKTNRNDADGKERPDWLFNKWNGIGTDLKEDEEPRAAMVATFLLRTGVATQPKDWQEFQQIQNDGAVVIFFKCILNATDFHAAITKTEEHVARFQINQLRGVDTVVANLDYLLPMAINVFHNYGLSLDSRTMDVQYGEDIVLTRYVAPAPGELEAEFNKWSDQTKGHLDPGNITKMNQQLNIQTLGQLLDVMRERVNVEEAISKSMHTFIIDHVSAEQAAAFAIVGTEAAMKALDLIIIKKGGPLESRKKNETDLLLTDGMLSALTHEFQFRYISIDAKVIEDAINAVLSTKIDQVLTKELMQEMRDEVDDKLSYYHTKVIVNRGPTLSQLSWMNEFKGYLSTHEVLGRVAADRVSFILDEVMRRDEFVNASWDDRTKSKISAQAARWLQHEIVMNGYPGDNADRILRGKPKLSGNLMAWSEDEIQLPELQETYRETGEVDNFTFKQNGVTFYYNDLEGGNLDILLSLIGETRNKEEWDDSFRARGAVAFRLFAAAKQEAQGTPFDEDLNNATGVAKEAAGTATESAEKNGEGLANKSAEIKDGQDATQTAGDTKDAGRKKGKQTGTEQGQDAVQKNIGAPGADTEG